MNDLISRQAAIDALDVLCQEHRYRILGKRETYSQYNEAWQDALDRAEGAIFNLPSAQPEPSQVARDIATILENEKDMRVIANLGIIHCKDCKHHWTHSCMDAFPREICDLDQTFYDSNLDYCSLAERRTDEQTVSE